MRNCIYVSLFILSACGGSLSEEQRQKMKEQMELHKIKRVSESEITEAAFARGRQLVADLDRLRRDSTKLDSMMRAQGGTIRWLVPGKSNALAIEQQLIDAYIAAESGAPQDNVQQIRNSAGEEGDSILYTKPVVSKMPDGADKLEGVWNIWLSKKQLILSMDKK
jgi:hypothetical protein